MLRGEDPPARSSVGTVQEALGEIPTQERSRLGTSRCWNGSQVEEKGSRDLGIPAVLWEQGRGGKGREFSSGAGFGSAPGGIIHGQR